MTARARSSSGSRRGRRMGAAPDGRPVFLVGTFLRLVVARIREEHATNVARRTDNRHS
jgi:hypothetical protein